MARDGEMPLIRGPGHLGEHLGVDSSTKPFVLGASYHLDYLREAPEEARWPYDYHTRLPVALLAPRIVPSMTAIAEPTIGAASPHGAEAGVQGAEVRLVRTTPSSHGGLPMFAITYPS